jgi:hypothetical protein
MRAEADAVRGKRYPRRDADADLAPGHTDGYAAAGDSNGTAIAVAVAVAITITVAKTIAVTIAVTITDKTSMNIDHTTMRPAQDRPHGCMIYSPL